MRGLERTRRTRLVRVCGKDLRRSIWQRTVVRGVVGLLHVCAVGGNEDDSSDRK